MTPFRFGDPPRQLFGIHQEPSAGADRGHAVVLCNPFGQEAIRCHRMLRVLGERLARTGLHVMRFDYYATGDSDGEDAEGDLDAWAADVVRAREEAARRSGGTRVSLFGLRLGGTLAAMASGRASVERLVLWDPVFDGGAYLAEIARQHAAEAEDERDVVDKPAEAHDGREVLGFPLGEALERQLAAISTQAFATVRAARVGLLHSGGAPSLEAVRAQLARAAVPAREVQMPTQGVWGSDEAMNSAYVPTDALQAIVAMFAEDA